MSFYYYEQPFFSFNDFARLFEGQGQRSAGESAPRSYEPKLDIVETPEQNLITAFIELPGLTKEEISIERRNDNRLLISGERKLPEGLEADHFIHRERLLGRFSRALPLPPGTQSEAIKATMENGLLTITFPKVSPEQASKKIDIA